MTRQFAHTWWHFAAWVPWVRPLGCMLQEPLGCVACTVVVPSGYQADRHACHPCPPPSLVSQVRFLQGRQHTWHAGAYTLFNTHEIATMSGATGVGLRGLEFAVSYLAGAFSSSPPC